MNADALAAHARDELGISEVSTARPIQAALTSAATFSAGAVAPVLAAVASPSNAIAAVAVTSLLCLAMLGYVGARLGGGGAARSEDYTSELQSLMRISYSVFCLKK